MDDALVNQASNFLETILLQYVFFTDSRLVMLNNIQVLDQYK